MKPTDAAKAGSGKAAKKAGKAKGKAAKPKSKGTKPKGNAEGGPAGARPATNANGITESAALTPGSEPDQVLSGLIR